VDEAAQRIGRDEPEHPQYQQDDGNGVEHGLRLFFSPPCFPADG
jgi:hypothetical protein